ncbi:hypothetical protein MOQ_004858 [Trypanosoma cruzi marinkellei]|uniref:Uncharacterized protein n=1 Tax=Trypanosoma cruzi marinkellei TaxID=85056 RepID=K2N924_TRYCR|nr:hypothetical protein MOQ_004858 [Trypanosoma cruzi marinkellei]
MEEKELEQTRRYNQQGQRREAHRIRSTEKDEGDSPGMESPAVPILDPRAGGNGPRYRRSAPGRAQSAAGPPAQRSAARSVQNCLREPRATPEATDGDRRHRAQKTREGRPTHRAAGGGSNAAPKAPPSATDPNECEGARPNNHGGAQPPPLGPPPGPDGTHGEALRYRGRAAKRAVSGCSRGTNMQEPSRGTGDVGLSYPSAFRGKRRPVANPADLSRRPAASASSCHAFLPHASEMPSSLGGRRGDLAAGPATPPSNDCCASGRPCVATPQNTARRRPLRTTPRPQHGRPRQNHVGDAAAVNPQSHHALVGGVSQ